MQLPQLFRRRQVWLPTAWTCLLLLIAAGTIAWLAARHLSFFLSPNEPTHSRLLVVEGWMDVPELDQAVTAYRSGGYDRVVTTGGPIPAFEDLGSTTTYAERARNYLVRKGVPADLVVSVPAPASPQHRSFLNAVMVREWATRAGLNPDTLDVFSAGVHSRRSWLLYQIAFGAPVRVGILSAQPSNYDLQGWWRTSEGTKEVMTETIAWLWTEAFFHPGKRGSQDELWGVQPVR